jgi:excisionase family DNA binding protein
MTKRNLADPDWEPSDEDFAELLSHVGDDVRASQAALRRKFDAMVAEAAKGQETPNAPEAAAGPMHAVLTVQQAADFLNVSKEALVGLLEATKLPCLTIGSDRRVLVTDLVAYKERDDAERRAVADELAAEAQKLDLGY